MSSTARSRQIVLIALPLIAALIAGTAVYTVMSERIAASESALDVALDRISDLESRITTLAANEDMPEPGDGDTADSPTQGDAPGDTSDSTADGRYFCYIRDMRNEADTLIVTVDFAEFLLGAEANAAAVAAGEESPPPNDYWISNVNPKLRDFVVRKGATVRLATMADGVNPSGYAVSLGQWQDFFVGMSPGMERVQDVPYWIEVSGGTVTLIEEQYLP
ncbi:MAG: hypothetical protein U1E29_18170 [Coriobacteriia bacterium]|nr:hypothetical protein [Coriobacteriia bacterium]